MNHELPREPSYPSGDEKMSEKHKKHQKRLDKKQLERWRKNADFRDSLTELENFIDSYAAEEETDDDDEAEGKRRWPTVC